MKKIKKGYCFHCGTKLDGKICPIDVIEGLGTECFPDTNGSITITTDRGRVIGLPLKDVVRDLGFAIKAIKKVYKIK